MSEQREIRIEVPVLARVEGEGALELTASGGRIEDLRLRIFEPPRYFEKFLEGRGADEVLDVVARICGICPVAYQMTAVQALEQAFGVEPAPWILDQRRLMYCGEWLQSHALHIHLLALPDFLGFDNAIAMAQKHPEAVRRGLRLQRLGNDLIRLFGGRSVHPVGMRVGGFHRAPDPARAAAVLAELRDALPDAEALVAFTAGLDLPEDDQEFTSVALRHENEYPMYSGRIVSDRGLDLAVHEYPEHFEESHVAHSTALYAHLHGQPYLVGPLARLNLNHDRLSGAARAALAATGLRLPSRNMFHSVIARAVEVHEAVLQAIELLERYRPREPAHDPVTARFGQGHGATEAPRGLLWHRYRLDADGMVRHAQIVPPTSQNQARIEDDLRRSLESFGLHHDDDALRLHGEMVIRNYDPCISCATHFLKVRVRRR
ncbi:hydrogenase/sulfur reductase, alpha subunit [Thioalkalivibrio nitratireducens DSM 14787]|uniref:Hydrogenase/sulfur reductase, alpha subunit n=1 Tax=Thioalkalivibrio nitratireducens (strain DSM 14787 / UNIQEM 213 / ALEN2) TaxID=1255043 RepID=L0DXX5_THIND|nr:Ni/Fe hydrogenase subunit alpha [Thioalkalivibrio nitratireducens]AGA33825.1 hydrogenase/sulfur reductase, alpha subunit [Thioalkalivibrio nitratireducens DSM 14787]